MGDGPPCFRRDSSCPAVLRIHFGENEISITGLLPSPACLSMRLHLFHSFVTPYKVSYNPKKHASWFGLFPVSLAATQGIAFAFSSSGYLDVSVPRVCLLIAYFIQLWIRSHYESWVPPFGYLWIFAHLQLPKAFRRLSRPSSTPCA